MGEGRGEENKDCGLNNESRLKRGATGMGVLKKGAAGGWTSHICSIIFCLFTMIQCIRHLLVCTL